MSQQLGIKVCVTLLLSGLLVACGADGQSLDGLLGGGVSGTPTQPYVPSPNSGFDNNAGGQNPIFEEDFVETGPEGTFRQQCAACHGIDGKGVPVRGTGPIGPGACVVANCFDQNGLADYVSNNMPRNAPVACSGSCADEMAEYILTTFADNRLDVPATPILGPPDPQAPAAQRQFYNQFCEQVSVSIAASLINLTISMPLLCPQVIQREASESVQWVCLSRSLVTLQRVRQITS
ncbi:MAG: cytochrome c [Gammaproteobacteria bacterium]